MNGRYWGVIITCVLSTIIVFMSYVYNSETMFFVGIFTYGIFVLLFLLFPPTKKEEKQELIE